MDLIGLEVGYRLIPLVDRNQAGELCSRASRRVRSKLSQELGFLVQPVHIRDNLELKPERVPHRDPGRAGRRGRDSRRT